MFRIMFIHILINIFVPVYGQEIKGVVIDSQTNEPISLCHLSIDGIQEIIFTNTQGEFEINVPQYVKRLCFSHVNYKTKYININYEDTLLEIKLDKVSHSINTITLSQSRISSIDFIAESISKFRNGLESDVLSKALFVTKCTSKNGEEYSEFFGNLSQKKGKYKYYFKQGYIDIGSSGSTATLNLDAALLILKYNLNSTKNAYLPPSIMRVKKRKIKRKYSAELIDLIKDSIHVYVLKPKQKSKFNEHWTLWINKSTQDIDRIILTLEENEMLEFSSVKTKKEYSVKKLQLEYAFNSSKLLSIKQELSLYSALDSIVQISEMKPYGHQSKFSLPIHDLNIDNQDMYTYYLNVPSDSSFWKKEQYKSQFNRLTKNELENSKNNLKELIPQRYVQAVDFKSNLARNHIPKDEIGNIIKVKPNSLFIQSLQHLESSIYFNYNCIDSKLIFQIVPIIDMQRTFILDNRPLVLEALSRSKLEVINFASKLQQQLNQLDYICDHVNENELLSIYQKNVSELKDLMRERDIYQDVDWSGRRIHDQYKTKVRRK